MKKLLSISILALLSACANQTPAQKTATTNAINNVISGAVDYAQGNDVGAVINGIQGASYFVRSLQSTPNAANPDAVAAAVTEGTVATPTHASPALTTLGTTVANAVVTLTGNGTAPNAANEAVAAALDKAVIQIAAPSQASLPVQNAAFLRLSRADQRDATILFTDERKTAAVSPRVILNGEYR